MEHSITDTDNRQTMRTLTSERGIPVAVLNGEVSVGLVKAYFKARLGLL